MTIEERAVLLLNEAAESLGSISRWCSRTRSPSVEALCRALEAHDAERAAHDAERAAHAQFRQEVSAAVVALITSWSPQSITRAEIEKIVGRFILPKPDPLVEAIREASVSDADDGDASRLRAALAKRGLKLVEVGDAD